MVLRKSNNSEGSSYYNATTRQEPLVDKLYEIQIDKSNLAVVIDELDRTHRFVEDFIVPDSEEKQILLGKLRDMSKMLKSTSYDD